MGRSEIRNVDIRKCPKCGSYPDVYEEIGEIYTTWHIEGGKIDRKQGYHNYGDIKKIQASCSNLDCRHVWTLRGVTQIDDML